MPKFSNRPRPGKASAIDDLANVAALALAFLAEDERYLAGFMQETGLGLVELRAAASDPAVPAAALEHVLANESLLLTFCAHTRLQPQFVSLLGQLLRGGEL